MERRGSTLLRLGLMALLIALCVAQDDWNQICGSQCKCEWVSGKKTAECIRKNLNYVPNDLSSEIQILDLTENHIPYLPHDAFSEVNLINLHKLVIRECQIDSIDTDAFNGLKIVIEIDLTGNKITKLFPGTFVETERLRILYLNNNSLEYLENGLFQNLIYLQKVILSENRLAHIGDKPFRNLPGLRTLTLDGNNLTSVRLSTFENLSKLNSLELHNNPWNCNCHLKRFRDWTINRRLDTKSTSCSQPSNLAGKMWNEMSSKDFDCRPKVVVASHVQSMNGGGDVKLWCRTSGIPKSQLAWIHRARILNNSTKRKNGSRNYVLEEENEWLNLTIPDASPADEGYYICMAKSTEGSIEKNISVMIVSDTVGGTKDTASLPLALGLGVTFLLLLLVTLTGFVWYCKLGRARHHGNSADDGSFEQHGLGEPNKLFIAAVNPVKPTDTSRDSDRAELNKALHNDDSVFTGGPSVAVRNGGEKRQCSTSDLAKGALTRSASYRHFYSDHLWFPEDRGTFPPIESSTIPDSLRLTMLHQSRRRQQLVSSGLRTGRYSAAFATLPHNRTGHAAPSVNDSGFAVVLRPGYVTIPRRPRIPSWTRGPPSLPAPRPAEGLEPIYDKLGLRTTADGSSVLSLNNSPEPGAATTMRGRPLPRTPLGNSTMIQCNTPNVLTGNPSDRAAPEWQARLLYEKDNRITRHEGSSTLGRKLPPRPPPKPEKRLSQCRLFEDEGEDGTEV